LLPALRERTARAEQLRRLPDETFADFQEAGLFRALQPRRHGGFELDPALVRAAQASAERSGVANLVTFEKRDIFTLDLSNGPTVVTLYLLPRLNAKLLPQLQKLPAGARVVSVAHRLGDIKPDQQVTVDTEDGEFTVYLWRVETLKAAK